ncbi:MAG TPA: hypothetical protein VGG58_02810 [Candidatus Acidoferrum sp.]
MVGLNSKFAIAALIAATLRSGLATSTRAQEPPPATQDERPVISRDRVPAQSDDPGQMSSQPEAAPEDVTPPPTPTQPLTTPANGRRSAQLPVEAYAVVPGTKFLVRLEEELNTEGMRRNCRFKVRTLEPLEAGSGIYLPAGAEIVGHISRVESAGIAGRAKIWLTFDDIRTNFGPLPIVAEVIGVPGDHSVKVGTTQEGLIEGRTSTQQAAAEAAAAGAALGAIKGVKDKDKKEIAEGAMAAAIAAYLVESGRGHEVDLPRGAKLEVELERALYLVKN